MLFPHPLYLSRSPKKRSFLRQLFLPRLVDGSRSEPDASRLKATKKRGLELSGVFTTLSACVKPAAIAIAATVADSQLN